MSPSAFAGSSFDAYHAPEVLLRGFYLAASLLIVVIQLVPALRRRFLAYGSRATSTGKSDPAPLQEKDALGRLLDYAASLQVPHNYFAHFYVVSVVCSLFWGWYLQLWHAQTEVQVVWALMLLQGLRRMLESYAYTSASKSTMWFAHWLLGLLFYLTMNVAIVAEGHDKELGIWATHMLAPVVLTAHALQHSYHAYLYRLRAENKGYQLPAHPLFPNLLCPHYTCEVVIYALLSVLAAPRGRMVNWTVACGTIFVVTNLGVTAIGTKEWYVERFGYEKAGHRKRMIPGVW